MFNEAAHFDEKKELPAEENQLLCVFFIPVSIACTVEVVHVSSEFDQLLGVAFFLFFRRNILKDG